MSSLPESLAKRWEKWEQSLQSVITFAHSIPVYQEPIREVELHLFGDASGRGMCTAVYAVVKQDSGVTQRLSEQVAT
jgi:hypothetical protein